MCAKYINMKLQIADIFAKGSFSVQTWNTLCRLLQIGPIVENSKVTRRCLNNLCIVQTVFTIQMKCSQKLK